MHIDMISNDADKPVVLAVASFGGHLVQLMRMMRPVSDACRLVYVSTAEEGRPEGEHNFYLVQDFSRTNFCRAFGQIKRLFAIMRREKPDMIISTGAAPGLIGLLVGRLMGIHTIWIDSVANADRLSLCGRIAVHIADRTLTQWPHLAAKKVEYHGNVL